MNKSKLLERLKLMNALDRVCLDGELVDDRMVVYKNYDKWEVFYFERGSRFNQKVFYNESDAYLYVFERVYNSFEFTYKYKTNWSENRQISTSEYEAVKKSLELEPINYPLSYLNAIRNS